MTNDKEQIPHGNNDGEKENLDFTFSDIPVLGPDIKGKREAFSFESFQQPGKQPVNKPDHISSYTKLLQSEAQPQENSDSEQAKEETLDSTQPLDENYIEQQRQKWEKAVKAKIHSDEKPSRKIAMAAGGVVIGLIVLVVAVLFFLNTLSKPEPPSAPTPLPTPRGKPSVPSNTAKTDIPPVTPPPATPTTPVPPATPSTAANGEKTPTPSPSVTDVEPETKATDMKSPELYLQELEALFIPPPEPPPPSKDSKAGKGKTEKIEKLPDLKERISTLCMEMFAAYPTRIDFHAKIQDILRRKNQSELMLELYGKWLAENPDSAMANYLYGKLMSNQTSLLRHMKRAVSLNPFFQEAYLEIANYYTRIRDWKNAAETYADCMKNAPAGKLRFLQTLAEIRDGQGDKALKSYEKYLKERKSLDMPLRMLEAAQYLPSSKMAERYLFELKEDPLFESEAFRLSLKQKALYGGLREEDFEGFFPPELRLYQILYFLVRDMDSKVLMMPTSPNEFPDFWKVFVSWKEDDPSWKTNAEKLVERHRTAADKTYYIIASVWLGTLKPEEARNMTEDVAPEKDPLFHLMLAEYYKRNKNPAAAKVMYSKALDIQEINPYKALIEHYMKK